MRTPRGLAALFALAPCALLAACSSPVLDGSEHAAGAPDSRSAEIRQGTETCAAPGGPVVGPADVHCRGHVRAVSAASCDDPDPRAVGPTETKPPTTAAEPAPDACRYGATLSNDEGDDDECKYHLKWSSTPLCQGEVIVTVSLTSLTDGSPVANIPGGLFVSPFQPKSVDAPCDVEVRHPGESAYLDEKTPGSGVYQGVVRFDATGPWTMRFHIHDECSTTLDASPHAHVAFRLSIP